MSRLTEMGPGTGVVGNKINAGSDLTGHRTDTGIVQEPELAFHGVGAVHIDIGAHPEKTNKLKRRLWEFHSPLICKILGLAFDEMEEGKIVRKLKLKHNEQFPPASEIHGVLVNASTRPNPVSKYLDKMLEERFELYRKRIEGLDQRDISRFIEERGELKDVPLPALIWFAIRHQHQEIDRIEARVFSTIHAMEHRALRLYDDLSRMLPGDKPENVVGELKGAHQLNNELQKRYTRSEQKREQLRAEIGTVEREKQCLTTTVVEQRQLNERLREDLAKLGGESALAQIESLKEKNDLLAQEIKALTEELVNGQFVANKRVDLSPRSKVIAEDEGLTADCRRNQRDINLPLALNGKRVAFVGGLETLLPHYRQTVEHLGGIFLAHSGKYTQGEQEIEKLVDKADIVFCPVDINSHHACRHCKKTCKLRGKACYFLRSSSLSMFRRELIEFARGSK